LRNSASNGIEARMSLRPRARIRPRAWGISLIGEKRRRLIGFVEAIDEETAKAAAVDELRLSHEQRKRLVVQELPGRVKRIAVPALSTPEQRSRLVV
jgi:hypothetical protein